MIVLAWLLAGGAAFALLSLMALWSYGRFARRARGPDSHALPPGDDTPLDTMLAPLQAAHRGESGLALVPGGFDAFALRAASAAQARRSLDIMVYIWNDDRAGRLLAHDLLAAADRGVRVRLLLDDVNTLGFDPKYLALNAHPRVEVRHFNPIRARRTMIGRGFEILLSLVRINRRLHCKAWIADGRLAIVGGRNVSDSDFALLPRRRRPGRDLDLLMAGPVVAETAAVFDAHWNSGLALPITALWNDRAGDLRRYRERLAAERRAAGTRLCRASDQPEAVLADGVARLRWAGGTRVVADPPEKVLGRGERDLLADTLDAMIFGATRSVRIATPYFVPGTRAADDLVGLARRGISVEVLTNALRSTDHAAVHGAYRWYRLPLMTGGVRLREFDVQTESRRQPEMLHAKVLLVDDRRAFVGSFNFDMRSAFLNAEMGVIFADAALIDELCGWWRGLNADPLSWELGLSGGREVWRRGGTVSRHDPGSSVWRRGLSWIVGKLPIHGQL